MTTTLLALEALLSQAIGDWREFDTSSNITTGSTAKIVATTLGNYDGGVDDYFNNWFAYITEGNNSGKLRNVKDWLSTATTLKLRGSALSAESSAVTVRLHRFNRDDKIKAINRAIEQLYPSLFLSRDNLSLITGNILPDASFEWWTSSSAHKFLSTTNATLAKTAWSAANAVYIRGQYGTTSMKITAGAADGYAYLSSHQYPRLLDLQGKTVNFYAWAYPEVANDAFLTIYTVSNDGVTTQTLNSTTACPASYFTKLELENQALNDDLDEIQIRFRVHTNAKYSYFDDAIVCGMNLYEYMLPEKFQDGHVSQVYIQRESYSDNPAYDIQPRKWSEASFNTIDDGTYKYLRLSDLWTSYYRLRLLGITPLESLSADTDTISLDGGKLNLIVAQAALNLYLMQKGSVSSEDKSRYEYELMFWQLRVKELKPTLMMMRHSERVKGLPI